MRVSPEGPRDAKIALIGEAPGAEEERTGRPFVGTAGWMLNKLLSSAGIDRSQCYIDNVVDTRPPRNNFGIFYEDKIKKKPSKELLSYQEKLRQRIGEIKPNVVVPMGNEAVRAIYGNKNSITKLRGSILKSPYPDLYPKIIPTYHPSYVNRQYEEWPVVRKDLDKIREESISPKIQNTYEEDFLVYPSFEQAIKFLRNIKNQNISFDIETVGPITRCIGIATSSSRAICIPLITNKNSFRPGSNEVFFETPNDSSSLVSHWSYVEELEILKELNRIFLDPSVGLIAQNLPFDTGNLCYEFGFNFTNIVMDTMVAHHECYMELPKSLDFLASIYTPVPLYSDYDSSSDYETFVYNCKDCIVTYMVYLKLLKELEEHGLTEYYYNHCHPCLFELTRMGNRGVDIDRNKREEILKEEEQKLKDTEQKLESIAGQKINPNSPKDMPKLLYDTLGLPRQYHRKTGRVTTDEKTLERLANKYPQHSELIKAILDYRGRQKLISTYLKAYLDPTGRFLTSYNFTGAKGRISSSETAMNFGGNIQQIPREDGNMRRIFLPPQHELIWTPKGWEMRDLSEPYLLAKFDLSQAEARVVAWHGRMFELITRWSEDPHWDIHTWNAASNIFNISENEVDKFQRYVSKCGVHGGNYALGAKTASSIYNIDFHLADQAIQSYRSAVPVEQWWEEIQEQLFSTRSLKSPLGAQRIFFGRLNVRENHETFRSAYSFIPQSVVCDITNAAAAYGRPVTEPLGWYPLIQVHDELVWAGPKSTSCEALKIIKNLMERPVYFDEIDQPLIIPSEPNLGPNWKDQEEVSLDEFNV